MSDTPHSEDQLIFQVGNNKESQLTPWVFFCIVVILILLSAIKMPTLSVVSLPVLGTFLWVAITLIRQSRQPWIVASKSSLKIKYTNTANKTIQLTVLWENIKSVELSQPYKDQLIIHLLKPITVGSDDENASTLITSNKFYDIDPDDLLYKLSTCLNSKYSNLSQAQYVPNAIPLNDRVIDSFFVLILIGWGIYAVIFDDLPFPTKRGAMHLHGIAMWLMLAAFTATAANLISWVLDHYDQHNNEKQYRTFRMHSKTTGYLLFGISLVVWLIDEVTR